MKLQRIYIDTSVIGGCFDDEFAAESTRLLRDFETERYRAVISDVVALEINNGHAQIQEQFQRLMEWQPEWVSVTNESLLLAEAYQRQGILTPKYFDDGLHIALATVAEVDVLVSWNFKHVVNFQKIRLFNSVNLSLGYKPIQIFSPLEVATDEDD